MDKELDSLKYKYELALKARNFHYDNFSKWSTYFYVAIGAIFIGYCTISTSNNQGDGKEHLKIVLLLLGYICSILWYLSNKGYYFWALNFIKIINYYEKKVFGDKNDERVYSILAHRDTHSDVLYPHNAANYSTSKISLVFSYLITFSWGILLFKKTSSFLTEPNVCCTIACCIFLNILVIALLSILGKYYLQSDIKNISYLNTNFAKDE